MKIHYFGTNDDFPMAAVLQAIAGKALGDRERQVAKKIMFMEEYDVDGDFHQLDLTQRRRTHGPGHSRPGLQTVDFNLGQDDGFGEQTCAVWHAPSRYMAVQYNHYGVRPSAIRDYLSMFGSAVAGEAVNLEMEPQLNTDTYERLGASPIHARLQCGFDSKSVVPTEGMAKLGVPLQRIMEIRDSTDAVNIEVTVSLGRRSGTGRYDADGNLRSLNILSTVRQALGMNPSKLVAAVKSEDGPMEILDLLEHRQVDEVADGDLRLTGGRRWSYQVRARATQRRLATWLQQRP